MAEITLKVKLFGDSPPSPVTLLKTETVGDLKRRIGELAGPEKAVKQLIYMGRILSNEAQTIEECKLQNGSALLVRTVAAEAAKAPPAAAVAPAAAAAPAAASAAVAAPPAARSAAGASTAAGAASSAAAAAPRFAPPPAHTAAPPLRTQTPVGAALVAIRAAPATAQECLSTVLKIVDNIVAHPLEAKYRKIKKGNAAFRRRVGDVPGGDALLRALGFTERADDGGSWVLEPNPAAWSVLTSGRAEVQVAVGAIAAGNGGGGGAAAGGGATGGGAMARGGGGFSGLDVAAIQQQLMVNPALVGQVM
ncbi:unnamed protein product, partial [Phaeothamnion confervicola]